MARPSPCSGSAEKVSTITTTKASNSVHSSQNMPSRRRFTLSSIASPPSSSVASSFLPQKYTLDHDDDEEQEEEVAAAVMMETTQPPSPTILSSQQQQPSPSRDKMYHIYSSLFAGVGSGVLASMICAPLDVLRTRMQVWGDVDAQHRRAGWKLLRQIFKKEGFWRGGFRGLGATLLTVPVFWGLYFPLYDELKQNLSSSSFGGIIEGEEGGNPQRQRQQPYHPALVHCASAILAGGVADVVCNPMFVVRTRLQTEALHHVSSGFTTGILSTIRSLYEQGGISIFWRGMTASLMGLSHVAVQFPIYEWLKQETPRWRRNLSDDQLLLQQTTTTSKSSSSSSAAAVDVLLASGLSKMCASLMTYPHEVVRSRMMDYRSGSNAAVKLLPTMRRIWKYEGWRGFYAGLHVSLIRVVPNCCITFLTYELMLQWSRKQLKRYHDDEEEEE